MRREASAEEKNRVVDICAQFGYLNIAELESWREKEKAD